MAACFHVNSDELKPPSPSQVVYREDCTQCFDSVDDDCGINVCLSCFNGGCAHNRDHALMHFKRFGHPLALNIKRSRKKIQRDEPPQKVSKLAIAAETDDDRYDMNTRVLCYHCCQDDIDQATGKLPPVIDGVMSATPFSRREEVKAWEQEFTPCEHTLCIEQRSSRQLESQELASCSMCNLKENLWLCLECGNLGCGRSQFGGVGGNSHGLAHFESTSHAVAVKLGSITAEGSADVFCYKCNEERIDPDLAGHLGNWGINLADREKTEKSLMEMQVEHNLRWEFSMTTEDGHELRPVFGPGLTGLKNLGNSCYLSSVIQCLFSLPEFSDRYYHEDEEPPSSTKPAEDLETQMRKLADGILSGRYSRPATDVSASPDTVEVPHQKGLAPAMFKHLVGRGHEEFSTMRQQDAFEFLLHIFKLVSLSKHPERSCNPIESFAFSVEQRLQCLHCKRVRYKVDQQDNISLSVPARHSDSSYGGDTNARYQSVTISECLDAFTSEEKVELRCPSCNSEGGFSKRSSFRTLPQELVINARRFELVNWVPTKLDIPVEVDDGPIDFTKYLASGPNEDEELLPDIESSPQTFMPNEVALSQLLGMGFPQNRSEKSLYMTGNSDAEAAMNWLFTHTDDPNIDEPLFQGGPVETLTEAQHDSAQIMQLSEMGIDVDRARIALAAVGNDVNRAIDWVFSHPEPSTDIGNVAKVNSSSSNRTVGFDAIPACYRLQSIVCHKGSSVHAGHYVAVVRKTLPGEKDPSWIMYNDEKVVQVDDVRELKRSAYLYFFSRV
ncbi:ubiquitin-specific protease UBP14 [Aspergillus saccharolyticus JOP 1030-1]|uniref:Ubiquitin carboxyl-terminal hydrolase n=1 Tax=Aspergillus saccharolyticus JOP 1030-1 TaxID=1450539 RepID=A0A318ZIE3_9EURO|nr:ubiquitinyl hydrolase [Aspergillus saccharolyticus JOP 1030-1]PYH47279.1 ubiquitinyl hydrolase [Aspergillus saccharolyticus JOP 1030-1]